MSFLRIPKNVTALSKFSRTYFSTSSRMSQQPDGLILGVYKDLTLANSVKALDENVKTQLTEQLKNSGATGKLGELRVLYGLDSCPKQVAVVGLGKAAEASVPKNMENARKAAAIGARALREQGAKVIAVDSLGSLQGAVEGAKLGLYSFDSLKAEKSRKPLVEVTPYDQTEQESSAWKNGLACSEAQNFARILAETPANHMTPRLFADQVASKLSPLENVEVIVRDGEWAEEMKMGAFLSVTRGSAAPPRFVEIHYRGGKENEKPLALVGKGVTFDSGGISIKPSANMHLMKGDMGGAAAVAGAMFGIASLQLPINVVACIPLCENMPSGTATKPGDVITAMNGKTIEVLNTDAEGRLILADAIYYASTTFKPHTLIDVATLTGAMVIALGDVFSGVFTNSDSLWKQLDDAGHNTSDMFWRMPLHPSYKKLITESPVADLMNVGSRAGGSCTAAIFLKEFVAGLDDEEADEAEQIRFAHIDIAGSMDSGSTNGYTIKGMTGRPTRSLIEFARTFQ
ncbi:cytosol aminopeptidase [Basidiobolus meristosporus CBS 931.73]|uniref:Cytosol aminopeptidase n=1 Tax=Basidiobolus meristosporus CBS 931.73 TaxID=1314790 RepID=A0A1Y1Y897_9FUNG|nr:cytosol aminopeptidase [Basidiobolus meristosporus CBS 931.73]|eukprot:ORX94250.1 cytosol aminopeptidase [Basidiobolus meristosporus CBS 931.73]